MAGLRFTWSLAAFGGHLGFMRLDNGTDLYACDDDNAMPYQVTNSQQQQEILQSLSGAPSCRVILGNEIDRETRLCFRVAIY
jgi:hypothetical protein